MINIETVYVALIFCYSLYLAVITIIPFLLLGLKDFPVVKLLINETKKGQNRLQLMIKFYSSEKTGAFLGIAWCSLMFLTLEYKTAPVFVHYCYQIISWIVLFVRCWKANKKISFIVENCLTYLGRV